MEQQELENLFDLIDELINVDMVSDTELGMRVREWYEKHLIEEEDDDELEWGDIDGEWDEDNEWE